MAHFALFIATFGFAFLWFREVAYHAFYALPKSLIALAKKQVKWTLPARFAMFAIVWLLPAFAFLAVVNVLAASRPNLLAFVLTSWGFNFGQYGGIVMAFVTVVTPSTRAGLRERYMRAQARHAFAPESL
ncbi:MAG: hypothetical protein K2X35_02805 [Bryobacteraceae bacterium]|nr:hypothetical protein [Bryobacteraceae bacterium]